MPRYSFCCAALLLVGCETQPSPSTQPEPTVSAVRSALTAPVVTGVQTTTASVASPTSSSAPALSATASAAASSAPPSLQSTCAEGAYQHETPKFCISFPDGYMPSNVKSGGVMDGVLFSSNTPGTMDFQITWIEQPRSVYVEERNKSKAAAKEDPNALIGKTRDGKGLFVRYRRELGGQQVAYSESVLYKKGTIFWCKAQAFSKPKPPQGFLTACQTMLAR